MKIIKRISILCLCLSYMILSSCSDDYGANPFDNSPFTVSKLPKVLSFEPFEGKAGTEVTIVGVNFSTATDVAFDGKKAESFEIIDDTTIKAIVSEKTTTGPISVTNEKGTRASKEKFTFIKEAADDTPLDVNLAEGKGVTVSINEAANFHITNGKYENAWQVVDGATPAAEGWFIIDLGDVYTFDNIVTAWDMGAYATDYELLVSEDGEQYTSVSHTTDWTTANTEVSGIFTVGKQDITLTSAVKARYVKGIVKACNSPWAMTVCEVEVYKRNATGGEDDTPYDENIAVSRSVTVSTNEAANFHITNGKYENAWQVIDAGASPMAEGWFIVDLGDVMSFNNIITAWDMGAYATDYELLISENGDNYTTISHTTDWTTNNIEPVGVFNVGKQDIKLGNLVRARYIKGILKGCNSPWAMTICELEVYKRKDGSGDTPTVPEDTTPMNTNLALNKPITVSSTLYPVPQEAVDGNTTISKWATNDVNTAEHSLVIDLEQEYTINNIDIYWGYNNHSIKTKVLVSSDGINYTECASENYNPTAQAGEVVIHNIAFNSIKTRYVKAVFTAYMKEWGLWCYEFEVYKR